MVMVNPLKFVSLKERNYMKTVMKKRSIWVISLCVLFMGVSQMSAQETKNEDSKVTKVQKHTIMEKFAPDISLTVEERQQKRIDRVAEIRFRKSVLDTLDISERRRQKLLSDLIKNPFSDRLNKTMAEVKFEDEDVVIDDQDN